MTERNYSAGEIQDLTDRVFLLRDNIERGKITFAEHLIDGFRKSYGAIRIRSDGLVDPATVDGRIRAITMALKGMKYRDDAKNEISLPAIQEAYFELLEVNFGALYSDAVSAGVTPTQAATVLADDPSFVKDVSESFGAFVEAVTEFWEAVLDPGTFHLQDGTQLKAAFAGDIFPAHWENVVSTAGLYIDTTVLPCPVMKLAPLRGFYPPEKLVFMLIKHVFTAISYKEIATADVTPSIVVVLPDRDDFDPNHRTKLVERAEPAMLEHAKLLFGREFESLEHLESFCAELESIEDVLAEIKRPDRLLFDTAWGPDPREQLRLALEDNPLQNRDGTRGAAGFCVLQTCIARMPQALAALEKGANLAGTPLIAAETSWRYFNWMLDYGSTGATDKDDVRTHLHVVHALSSERDTNLQWLGAVPPKTVLEIRRNGHADEIRALLASGVSDLVGANPSNYFRSADRVVENLDAAFRKHQQQLLEAKRKKLKLYGIDVASCLVTGGIAVAAAVTSNPMLGAVSGILGVAGLPNLKDIKSRFAQIVADDRVRRSSPTGLLFRHIR